MMLLMEVKADADAASRAPSESSSIDRKPTVALEVVESQVGTDGRYHGLLLLTTAILWISEGNGYTLGRDDQCNSPSSAEQRRGAHGTRWLSEDSSVEN